MVVTIELLTPEVHNILCEVQFAPWFEGTLLRISDASCGRGVKSTNNRRRSMNFLAATRQHWWHGMWADHLGNPFWVQCSEGDLYTRPAKFRLLFYWYRTIQDLEQQKLMVHAVNSGGSSFRSTHFSRHRFVSGTPYRTNCLGHQWRRKRACGEAFSPTTMLKLMSLAAKSGGWSCGILKVWAVEKSFQPF